MESSLPSFGRASLPWLFCLLLVAFCFACDSTTDSDGCETDDIATDLHRVLYWGNVSPSQDLPNQGYPTGNIREPNWYQEDRILIRSARLDNDEVVRGIFEVQINPGNYSFQGLRTFAFPYLIRNYDYNPATQSFLITFSQSASDNQTALAQPVEPNLEIGDTLLDNDWTPLRAQFIDDTGRVVAYARDPATMIAGFYVISPSSSDEDSLLYPIDLDLSDALGFDARDGRILFGRTSGSLTQEVTELFELSVNSGTARLITTLTGPFASASIDRTGSLAIVSIFYQSFHPDPGSVVYVVDLSSGDKRRLNILTRPCSFAIADFASWSPTVNSFAFSGGGFSGEGDLFPRQLWVKSDVTR